MGIFKVEYYVAHPKHGWSETCHDNVLADNANDALRKFKAVHPDIKNAIVVDWVIAHY